MGIGTFGSFTQARLAIYAAQTGITVTGNNISNINTEGYTRQRLNQVSLYTAGADRYYSAGDIRTGQGALVKSLSQIRSPYLDIRYRTLNAQFGYADGRLETLNEIQQILDEVGSGDESKGEGGHGILGLEFKKLGAAFKNLVDQTGHQEYDNTVRTISENLVSLLNKYANKLEEVRENTVSKLEQNLEEVNGYLTTIRSLNEEIRKSEIHGDPALELRDERNVQIDKLSELIDINVTYSEEEIGGGLKVEKLTIRLDNANPDGEVRTDEALLIDGIFGAQIRLDKLPVMNKDLDPAILPFLDEKGNPTADETLAEKTLKINPNYDPKEKDQANRAFGQYLKEDGTGTNNKNLAYKEPTANPAYKPYLTPEGTPTASLKEAKKYLDPNYSMTVTELTNKIGEVYVAINKGTGRTVSGKEKVDDGKGGKSEIKSLFEDGRNSVAVATPNKPNPGDTTLMVYKRTLLPNRKDYAYTVEMVTKEVSREVHLDDNDLNGKLQAHREMLTEKGEFTARDTIKNVDENAGGKRGIPYYQRTLDLLANQFAKVMNEANQGFLMDPDGNYIAKEKDDAGKEIGVPITIKTTDDKDEKINSLWEKNSADVQTAILTKMGFADTAAMEEANLTGKDVLDAYMKGQTYDAAGEKFIPENKDDILAADGTLQKAGWGKDARGIFKGGVLFSNNPGNDDPSGITAANISISNTWETTHLLVRDYTCPVGSVEPASGASENIRHFEYLVTDQKFDFIPEQLDGCENTSKVPMLNGSFFEMWNNIGTTLGADQKKTEVDLNAHYKNLLSVDTSRDSVSSVDFNDEAMNLMMYSKSYNAACRLMTTIDTVLDKLINGTGVTT